MAGTATDYNSLVIAQTKGQLWANLAIPGANARLTLHTDGTPESVANPTAKHLGMTKEGAKFMVKPSYDEYFADEFAAPIKTNVGTTEASIEAELIQVMDMNLLELLTPGIGTYSTAAGYMQVQLGSRAIVYTSIALIFPLEADATKFGVFHLYRANNTGGIEIGLGRKQLSGIGISFKGYEITSRAAVDTLGNAWKQI